MQPSNPLPDIATDASRIERLARLRVCLGAERRTRARALPFEWPDIDRRIARIESEIAEVA